MTKEHEWRIKSRKKRAFNFRDPIAQTPYGVDWNGENWTLDNATDGQQLLCNVSQRNIPITFPAPLWESDFVVAVVYCVLMGVALVVGTFGNIIILIITGMTGAMNKIGKHFVMNLAMADLCVTAIAEPMCVVAVIMGEGWFNDKWILCEMMASLCFTACICAFLSLTNVTINRYMYVCHYNSRVYHKIYTTTKTLILCLLCWICGFLLEFSSFIGWGDHYFDQKSHQCVWDRTADLSFTLYMSIFLVGGPLCLMGMCHILTFRKIWKTKYDVLSINKENLHSVMYTWKESMRASRTLVIVFFVFVSCWTPYAVVVSVDYNDTFSMETHLFITMLAHMHSSMNILIYTISNRKFRMSVWNLLRYGNPRRSFRLPKSTATKTTSQ